MTNINPQRQYNNIAAVLRFAFQQLSKNIYTVMPGAVTAYDAASRRASVQPSIDVETTDGRLIARPVIDNVPVLQPTGGGYSVRLPVAEGDLVLLLFPMRGLGNWLDDTAAGADRAAPTGGLMDGQHAVAVAGFGGRTAQTADSGSLALQNDDASIAVAIGEDGVTVTGDLTVTGGLNVTGNVTIEGGLTVNDDVTIVARDMLLDGDVRVTGSLIVDGSIN